MAAGESSILARKVRGPKTRVSGFPAIEPLCNAFASILATGARKELRSGIDVTVFGYEVVRHGDYLRQLHAPSAIYLLSFPESNGAGLIKAHPRLLGKVLDLSLGGDGEFAASELERPLTEIDLSIYGRFVDLVGHAFDDAIMEMCGRNAIGRAQRTRFEEQPGMVRIAPDRAEIFVVKLNFHIGDDRRGAGMDFVVPISTIEPLKRDLASHIGNSVQIERMWEQYMRDQVQQIALPTEAVIDLGKFSVAELSRLEQGQLLELPAGAIDQVTLRVETAGGPTELCRGRLGAKGRHKALRLTEAANPAFVQPLLDLKDAAPAKVAQPTAQAKEA